ncbi:hypothetical protein KI688_009747 [Linnemannia hyalina]|uniref:Crinkler effector protein N-terminal domain-containing protein n=1 Tax=Linnemannia hyalina TaxID=64524 RepID=A0A9P7XZW1_9FUNG|nr:hypothetical protein KI688_009747 [Linnemannia hyalina]
MSNNLLNLFCLVDGEATTNAFPVEIESTKTIGDLKGAILRKKPNDFRDVDANKLSLSRVSIHDDGAIHDKTELNNPRALLSTLFAASPDDNTYIIVQRPPQVHAPVPARPSPPQLKSIPKDLLEQELEVILNDIQLRPTTPSVDPMEVEAFQNEALGPFFKRTLPHGETARDIKLVMLGLELDKLTRTSDGETLHSIVEDDIGKYCDRRVVAMVAPSGSGKTATVVDLASKHFVIYCVCCIPSTTISPGFKDPNFITLAEDIESMYRSVIHRNQGRSQCAKDIDSEVKALAGERVKLEFLARLLFLQHLLDDNPDLEPLQFFREQTTKGAFTIGDLVYKLKEYDHNTIQAMLSKVQAKLQSILVSKRLGLVIALDEAQMPSSTAKNQIQSKFRRGFLTPLSATLSNMRATLVILGTALSLQDADHVYSAIAKPTNFSRITEFPRFNEKDVIKTHSKLVDMSDCEIPPAKRRKLTGRVRFSIDVVERLATRCSTQDSKQAILDDAVDKSIEHTMNGLRIGVRTILESDKTNEAARLLSRMVLAYHLQDAKISFSSQLQSDFVDKALCRLQQHPDGVHLIMDEPLVVEAVEEELKSSGKDPTFIDKFQFQIDEINTASGFGYMGSGMTADLAFLTACPPLVFPDKRYAGSLAIKFYSNDVPQVKHKENETSSDIRACFLMTDGDKLNSTLAATRHSYENAGIPSNVKGILRIHLEFPRVKGVKPVTQVRKDPTTRAIDVMVYINNENMDSFFEESIKAYRRDMIKLKKLIKYVCVS